MVVRAYLRGDQDALPLISNTTLIGKSEECDVIVNEEGVSEKHLVLEFCGCEEKALLTDLGRGTMVNRKLICDSTVEVGPNNIITLGNKSFQLVFNTKTTRNSKGHESFNQGSLVNREKMKKCEINYQNQQRAANLNPLTSTYLPVTPDYQSLDTLPSLNFIGYDSNSKTTKPSTQTYFSKAYSPYFLQNTSNEDLQKLVKDKDKIIVEMLEEITKLSNIESELREKDQVISAMKQHNFHKSSTNTLKCSAHHNKYQHNNKLLFQKITEENQRNEKLTNDLNDVKRSYQSSQGLTYSLQNEISNKEAHILKQSKQIQCLSKQLKQSELKVSSITVRCKKLTAENNTESLQKQLTDTKSKMRSLETRLGNQMELLENYKQQLTMTKNNLLKLEEEKNRTTKELNDLKQQKNKIQRDEKLLKVKCEQSESLYDKFKTKIAYLIYGAEPSYSENIYLDGQIIQRIQKCFNERNQLQLLKNNLEINLKNYESAEKKFEEGKEKIINKLNYTLEALLVSGRTCTNLKNIVDETLHDQSEFNWVCKLVSNCLQGELEAKKSFQKHLITLDMVVEDNKAEGDYLLEMNKKMLQSNEIKNNLEKEILNLKSEHTFQMGKAQKNIHETLSKEHHLAFEKLKEEFHSSFKDQLQNALEEQKSNLENALKEENKKLLVSEKKVEEKTLLLKEKEKYISEITITLNEAKKSITEKTTLEEERNVEILSIREACEKSIQQVKNEMETIVGEAEGKMKQYEEETRQHALTIVSLEKKIKNEKRKAEGKNITMATQTLNKNKDDISTESPNANTSELEITRQTLQYQQDLNTKLSRDLKSAQSKLSDMKGEISEKYKVEIEYNRSIVKKLQVETSENQQQLLKLTEIVKEQKTEISSLNKINKAKEEKICQLVKEKQLELKVEKHATSDQSCEVAIVEKTNPEWVENRHQAVIVRQREAIAELREQVKALGQLQAPLPGKEDALKQVVMLKRELAEIRLKMSLQKKEDNKENHLLLAASAQTTLERSSKNELQESVIASEKSYLDVVNTISQLIGLDQLIANRSFSQLPLDERDKLIADRKQDLKSFVNRLTKLKSTIENKDHLLQDYENSLEKVRLAEQQAEESTSNIELLRRSLIDKAEEISHLRKELDETRNVLNEEKLLNGNIKTRKQYKCKEFYPTTTTTNSTNQKFTRPFSANRKSKDKLIAMKKRRDYEFEVLKNESEQKTRKLYQTTARLVNLQNYLKKNEK